MHKALGFALAFTTLPVVAQAPIERPTQQQQVTRYAAPKLNTLQPIPGVWVRSTSPVQKVSADANGTEIRIEHGRATVEVHQPAANAQLLVDLPGGQTALIKDGVYTFNSDTNTARVLQGEARAFAGKDAREVRVKGYQQVVLSGSARATDASMSQLRADLLPNTQAVARNYGPEYGFRPYSDPYPYYAWDGYPYGWSSPYWSSPYWGGLGFGFGYYGGFGGRRWR